MGYNPGRWGDELAGWQSRRAGAAGWTIGGNDGMAYRFLLEVPEPLAADASVAVERVEDAQVILVRDSHGLGFDDSYVDLTVAAHSLRVLDSLYAWTSTLVTGRPEIRIVLHGGDRLALQGRDPGAMVAAIRRDQPWVERSIPKVGDHEVEHGGRAPMTVRGDGGLEIGGAVVTVPTKPAPSAGAGLDRSWVAPGAVAVREPERTVRLLGLNHVAVQVGDLAKAERFYTEFFGMELTARARRDSDAGLRLVDGEYRWDDAVRGGVEADVSFLTNGPLSLALHRAGRGARLERGVLDHLSVSVDAATFVNLKGEVLLRPLTVLRTTDAAIAFRDPFGLVWEVNVRGSRPEHIL